MADLIIKLWSDNWTSLGPLSALATNLRAIDNNCLIQAFWPHSAWDINKLKSCLPDQFIDHITVIPISNSTWKRTS